jgi:hypothetical protein
MRESPVSHLFVIGLIVSQPTAGWSQTVQNNLNNVNHDEIVIIIMPTSHCVAKSTSRDWWNSLPYGCTVKIPRKNWLDGRVLSTMIPADYYKPSKYEFSEIQNGVYKILPIAKRKELPRWTELSKTSIEVLKSFDPKSPQEKCGKIKNLPNTDPNNPPEVCFSE